MKKFIVTCVNEEGCSGLPNVSIVEEKVFNTSAEACEVLRKDYESCLSDYIATNDDESIDGEIDFDEATYSGIDGFDHDDDYSSAFIITSDDILVRWEVKEIDC